MTDPELVEVTQADREAAAALIEWHDTAANEWHIEGGADLRFFAADMPDGARRGIWDNHPFVQAFARHRIAAIAAYEAEQWRPIEELEAEAGEVLGWTDGCGYEVVRSHSDGHRYSGAFTADWVRWFRPLPAPPVGEG